MHFCKYLEYDIGKKNVLRDQGNKKHGRRCSNISKAKVSPSAE